MCLRPSGHASSLNLGLPPSWLPWRRVPTCRGSPACLNSGQTALRTQCLQCCCCCRAYMATRGRLTAFSTSLGVRRMLSVTGEARRGISTWSETQQTWTALAQAQTCLTLGEENAHVLKEGYFVPGREGHADCAQPSAALGSPPLAPYPSLSGWRSDRQFDPLGRGRVEVCVCLPHTSDL